MSPPKGSTFLVARVVHYDLPWTRCARAAQRPRTPPGLPAGLASS
jgi:hypothetical protein